MKSLTRSLSGPFLAALIAVSGCDQSAPPAPPAATSDVSVAQPDVQGPSAPVDAADSTPSANDALTPHPAAGAIEGLTRDALAAWKLADLDALMRLSPNGTPPIARDGTRFVASGASQNLAKVYTLVGGAWVQTGTDIVGQTGQAARPEGLALSDDGRTVALGFVNGTPRRVRLFSIAP